MDNIQSVTFSTGKFELRTSNKKLSNKLQSAEKNWTNFQDELFKLYLQKLKMLTFKIWTKKLANN